MDVLMVFAGSEIWLISAAIGLAAMALLWGVVTWRLRGPVEMRVDAIAQSPHTTDLRRSGQERNSFMARLLTALTGKASEKKNTHKSWWNARLEQELIRAGYRGHLALQAFWLVRCLTAALLPLLLSMSNMISVLSPSLFFTAMFCAGVAGFFLPNRYLAIKVNARSRTIFHELPEVLDLMVVAIEAGLSLDSAIRRVANEARDSSPHLSAELRLLCQELAVGVTREKALRNLTYRCGSEDVGSMAVMLIQADRFGVSILRSLKVLSKSMRTKIRQRLEEKAHKISIKLLIPVIGMIFPGVIMVMCGPAIMRIAGGLDLFLAK